MAESTFIFRKEEVQKLLRAFKDGKIEFLEPRFDYEQGISYPVAAEVARVPAEAVGPILDELSSLGVLVASVVNNVVVCPICGSFRFTASLRCPVCDSHNLVKGVMIEHLACGHLDVEKNFQRAGQLICPRCGKALKAIGVDYRRPGILYRCLDCDGVSSNPRKRYTCNNGHNSDEEGLIMCAVKAYRLNLAKRGLLEKETVEFEPLLCKFNDVWSYKAPAVISGPSDVKHEFAFALWSKRMESGQPDVVAEVCTHENEVSFTAVLAFQAKAMDVKAREKVIIVMPALDERGKLLASSYGMQIIEAKTASELQEKLVSVLRQLAAKKEEEALKFEAETLEKILKEMEGNA